MELAKESLDDICGPPGTQHTGDDAISGVTYLPEYQQLLSLVVTVR